MSKFEFSPEVVVDVLEILDIRHGSDFEAALQALAADVEKQQNAGKRQWHHLKRGTNYTEHFRAHLQIATKPLKEDDILVVYVDNESGRACAREQGEFEDGRFVEITEKETKLTPQIVKQTIEEIVRIFRDSESAHVLEDSLRLALIKYLVWGI